MWSKNLQQRQLTLDMELSTFCNARCPQCSRTEELDNVKKKEWLPLTSVTIAKFKKWFPPKDLNNIKNYHFSGTYGDPGMCKDLYKIVSYIIDNSTTATISINTNGSMRDENFWWDIGAKGQKRLTMIFDVDGINQEMHNFYRRGTTLSKVLNNMSAVLDTPAKVTVFTVLFKHNQNYLDDIRDMCNNLGEISRFDWVEGNNFDQSTYPFNDEDGNPLQLEQVTNDRPAFPVYHFSKDAIDDSERPSRRVRDHRHHSSIKDYTEIKCNAIERNNLKVSVDGVVTPCCHLSPSLERFSVYGVWQSSRNTRSDDGWKFPISPIIQEYNDNCNTYNLNNNSIFDIVNSQWFNKSLPESWNDLKTSCFGCRKVCGKV
jgi:MoaA/NifB/PqqE/SkfB family radical SAM enzyme